MILKSHTYIFIIKDTKSILGLTGEYWIYTYSSSIDFKISYLYFHYQRYKINPGPNW
nr:MAG TPA: hypothetical protein [Caudoviricetes sp.]